MKDRVRGDEVSLPELIRIENLFNSPDNVGHEFAVISTRTTVRTGPTSVAIRNC